MFPPLLEALRPKQWVKNIIIFASIIFSRNFLNFHLLLRVIFAFGLFCLLSSCIYLINDLRDLENDRQHPIKSKRPLPSGRLSPQVALGTAIALAIFTLTCAWLLGTAFWLVACGYFVLLSLYSLKLKQIVILDVMVLAMGFVLRVVAGGVVISVEISSWLILCTILLALFMALSKRRHEIILLDNEAATHRAILKEYSPYFLDQMIAVVTASTVMAYSLYTMAPQTIAKFGTTKLYLTIPFVLYGIFRYLYLVHQKKSGGNPTATLFTDFPLIVDFIFWLISVELIITFLGK